jgi:2-polyprenyl-3-methyl-5-hydroxy-6-metoxy-1,4-benzoquinol methylase
MHELPANAHVVGIDVPRGFLSRKDSINERTVGSIETYALPADSFDVIVCHDVLEHLGESAAACP